MKSNIYLILYGRVERILMKLFVFFYKRTNTQFNSKIERSFCSQIVNDFD